MQSLPIAEDFLKRLVDEERLEPAVIYIYRPSNDGDSFAEPPITINRPNQGARLIALLDDGRYIRAEIQHGACSFLSDNKDKPIVDLNLESGKEYFLEMDSSLWSSKAHLIHVEKSKAIKEMDKLKPLDRKYIIDNNIVKF